MAVITGETDASLFGTNAGDQTSDAFVAKFTAGGGQTRARLFGTGLDIAAVVRVDGACNAYVIGTMNSSGDNGNETGFIAKYDPNGSQTWLRSLNGTGNVEVATVALDSQGNVYASGITWGDLFATSAGGTGQGDANNTRLLG